MRISFRVATPSRWRDVETLFGERGACAGCWCMFWRLTRKEFDAGKGAANKRAFQKLVEGGRRPGILAYDGRRPVGWCALAPRKDYSALERSRILRPVDAQPVWSISCLFIDRAYRHKGVSVALLEAASDFAKRRGAGIVEGYPVEPRDAGQPAAFLWNGTASAFRRAGFTEVARRSPTRPIMRQ